MSRLRSSNLLISLEMWPVLEDEQINTILVFSIILLHINSNSMFIKALKNKMCDVKIANFVFRDFMLSGTK